MRLVELYRILRSYELIVIEQDGDVIYKGTADYIPLRLMDSHVNRIYPVESFNEVDFIYAIDIELEG